MHELIDLIDRHEDWIMGRVLAYAKDRGYTEYTSTLLEAWRASVCGLSEPLTAALQRGAEVPELRPDMDFAADPIAGFGILEAQRHRSRGITLTMFLGLMKYYRQAYMDLLVEQSGFDERMLARGRLFVERFFDRVELGFIGEWVGHDTGSQLADMQRANRDLTNEKNFYLTIFESLEAPLVLLDENGAIDNMNKAAQDLFVGAGVPGAVYYGEGRAPYLGEDFLQVVKGSETEGTVDRLVRTRLGIRQFEITNKFLLDVSGKFNGSVLVFSDVTERRDSEDDINRYRERLEDQVAERTAEASAVTAKLRAEIGERKAVEESLQKTIDQLTRSNTELERFANFASHDLKESARLVASYSELLTRRYGQLLDDSGREFLGFLSEGGRRMSQQVEDLLAYSRAHTRVHPFGEVDATRIVDGAVANLQSDIEETGAAVEIGELPRVWCDEFQIQEVIQHLIGNAIKFRAVDRAPVIRIACEARDGESEFAVADNGIGIDPMYAEQIFVIFKRLHTKDRYPGSGIGLAMCKRIIERHGGRIWMESEPGKGSTFRFVLPNAGMPTGGRQR